MVSSGVQISPLHGASPEKQSADDVEEFVTLNYVVWQDQTR